ncbi:hypothetical protein CCMA1212_009250 [Trichoderma ghanense]|uniref:Uncharacterized protein n=1 Tax=Trichoderma ghanense TaxID=65468 RepID=A0ABY2GUN2_9HYPO
MLRHDAAIKHLGNHWASLQDPKTERTRPAQAAAPREPERRCQVAEISGSLVVFFFPAGDGALRAAPPIGSLHSWRMGRGRRGRKDPSMELLVYFVRPEMTQSWPLWLLTVDTEFQVAEGGE